MYEFWYNYVKPKYDKKAKLCYMVTDSFIDPVKTEDIYEDITKDVGKMLDTLNHKITSCLKRRMLDSLARCLTELRASDFY